MEFLTRMFPELLRMLFLLTQSFIPRTCGLKNSFKSAFPFQSLIQLFHVFALRDKGRWLSDGDWRSPGSVSHRFIVPACCLLFWILSSQTLQGVFLRSCAFILRFWRGWGFSCVVVPSSGQQNSIMARFTFANRTHQSASHNWAVLLP